MDQTKPLVVTITGPSGSGKTVLSHLLRDRGGFEPLVSTTTRLPRTGERDGVDYHFIDRKRFDALLKSGGMIEHVEYDNSCYGVSCSEAQRAFGMNKPAVLVAEPHGVAQIHDYCADRGWNVLRVFVNNPVSLLMQRLLRRFHEDTRNLAGPELDARLRVYGTRIDKVTGFEQEHWVRPATTNRSLYEIVLPSFGPDNQHQAMECVFNEIRSMYAGTNSPLANIGPVDIVRQKVSPKA